MGIQISSNNHHFSPSTDEQSEAGAVVKSANPHKKKGPPERRTKIGFTNELL